VTDLPLEKQRMLERLNSSDEDLVGRTALLVDDDARNIFALSSVLERRGMTVLTATTGREAIELVESTPDLAIVLMDIMMPEMDGYQTISAIRERPDFRRLPIVAPQMAAIGTPASSSLRRSVVSSAFTGSCSQLSPPGNMNTATSSVWTCDRSRVGWTVIPPIDTTGSTEIPTTSTS